MSNRSTSTPGETDADPVDKLRNGFTEFLLRPYCLVPGLLWRYGLFHLSRAAGALYRFFRTGWVLAVLWLFLSIALALLIATTSGPGAGISQANSTSTMQSGTAAGTNASPVSTLSAAGLASGANVSTIAIAGNITAQAVDGLRSAAAMMTPVSWTSVFLLWIFGIVVYYGYRSRGQVLIGSFNNYVGDDSTGKFSDGIGALLAGELHRLRLIYAEVDDRRAIASIGGSSGQLDYAIKTGETGGEIANAISADTSMQFGPISIPIGAIAGVLSQIFSGPKITGSLHRDGEKFVLYAFKTGRGERSKSWRVEGRIAKSTDVTVDTGVRVLPVTPEGLAINLEEKNGKVFNLDVMVAELARRIFTDLTVGGTTRWRATYYFTEGLLDYRSCLLSRKDQLNNLRNAERRFLQAISEDGTFDLAWYNLGVVYSELKNLDAAEQAFLKAIQLNPERWEPYYALSLNRLNKIRERIIKEGAKDKSGYIELDDPVLIKIKEYELQDVIQPCRQVIELGSKNRKLSIYPNIYILTGLVYRMLALKTRLLEQEAEKFKQNVDESQNEEELRRRDTPVEDLQGDPYYYEERSLKFFRKASIDQREATRLSWRALCRCQCTSTDDGIRRESDIRYVSSTALWDLARTCFAYHEWKASITKGDIQPDFAVHFSYAPITWLLQQALFIDRTNAIVYANLGAVYCERKQFKKATNAFRLASQIDPTYPKYWVQSATSSDRAGWKNERELAIKKILEHPSWVHKNLSRRWQKRLFCVLQNAASQRSRDLFDILYFQGTFEGFEASPCPHDDAGRVNPAGDETNPRDSSDAVRFDEDACWERARRSYRAADKAVAERCGNPNEIIEAREHYKLALEALSQPKHDSNFQWKREVARRWAQGVIYNELARSTSRSDYYRESFDRLSEVHPLEIKERKIDIHLIESLLLERRGERRKFDAAFEIASRAQYRNPLGFEENFLWGRCFFATRDYKQALHHLESALLLEPFDIQTLRYIGYCYWKLGYYCQNREEKTNFWKQAIHYFDDAAKAISVEKLKHQSASSLPVRDRAEVDPLSARYDQEHFEVSLYLGDCYTGISEYGKALSHYEIAMVLAKSLTDTVPFECYCALKCAEALLHKRDHFQCELYLADIFSRFGQPPLAECEHQVTDEFFEALKDFLIRRMSCFHDSIDCAYAGEIYIRALIGQAYSYAERDTRLEVAFKLVDRAERILRLMEKDLKKGLEGLQNRENGTSPHGQGEQSEIERLHEFITSRACVLQADIHDKRGWIVFKQYKEPGNLKLARTSLHLAVALQPDPVYYYHLAIVYAALARETGKREICLRMALAYCVHALDMAPRFSLEEQVILLRGVIENHVKTLEGAFDGSLSKAYEKKKESGKEKTGIQYVFRWA